MPISSRLASGFQTRATNPAWNLGMTSNGLKDTIQSAVQLNKDHQYALNVYAERLEAELEAVDKLLVSP